MSMIAPPHGMVQVSPIMQALFQKAARMARFPTTVLIEGESGVGKEVLANWVHASSPRTNMPFVKVNCASIPESLLESELFGYERGAFTGAKREGNPGLFELADKGTLLLDEVGELVPSVQAKLLRVLQDREVRRIGGSWSRVIDVRVIASTNQPLRERMEAGQFRADLYYRLHVGHLVVPPLRDRREDIVPLLNYFMEELCQAFEIERSLAPEVVERLTAYDFPGNVRELRNLLEGLVVSTEDAVIGLSQLPPYIRDIDSPHDAATTHTLSEQVEAFERNLILRALREQPSIRSAARKLQVSHSTLIRKMQRHGIEGDLTP